MTILLATHNKGKTLEIAKMLADTNIKLINLSDCGITDVPAETGTTFLENARIKARVAVAASGEPSLADDSGLCVDALNGEPGVLSAEYGGFSKSGEHISLLLKNLGDTRNRAAAFICQLVLLFPDGREILAKGRCEGEILTEPRGGGGFGYDPIFSANAYPGRSMAELTPKEKNAISHRGEAIREMLGNYNEYCIVRRRV